MKIKELIEELKKYDPEAEVVLSADEEGNSFSPLEDIEGNRIFLKGWNELKLEELTKTYKDFGFDVEDVYNPEKDPEGVKAIVLWP